MIKPISRFARTGAIIPLLAISLVAILGVVALAIDIGSLALAKNQLQNAADAGAFAGARELNETSASTGNVNFAAQNVLQKTFVLGSAVTPSVSTITTDLGTYEFDQARSKFVADYGNKRSSERYGAVKVDINMSKPNSFARIFNSSAISVRANAQAVHRPRDIVMVLDFSGSMRFDSLPSFPHNTTKPIEGTLNSDDRVPRFAYYRQLAGIDGVLFNHKRGQPKKAYEDPVTGEQFGYSNLTEGQPELGNMEAIVDSFYTVTSGIDSIPPYSPGQGDITKLVPTRKAFYAYDKRLFGNQPYPEFQNTIGAGDPWPFKRGTNQAEHATTFAEVRGMNPREVTNSTRAHKLEDGTDRTISENGWTLGPGYWGKTFYIWPPDPNYDWRRRYFGTTDNSDLFDNKGIFKPAMNSRGQRNYTINYDNVIRWLKSGHQVFPENLVAGRVLYYRSIPDEIPESGGTADQRFWRAYIDYVLGAGCQDQVCYGQNTRSWGTIKVTPKSALTGSSELVDDLSKPIYASPKYIDDKSKPIYKEKLNSKGKSYSPKQYTNQIIGYEQKLNRITGYEQKRINYPPPYMHYNDNVVHPISNFWFGPLTMMSFLADYKTGRNWLPGTAPESPTWQLKSVVHSVLNEIENNHPNDKVGLVLFSDTFNTPWSPVNESMQIKKDRLYFPKEVIDNRLPFTRPYGPNFNKGYLSTISGQYLENGMWDDKSLENIPNAQGRTNPQMAFMLAYNQLENESGNRGRKGAKKLLFFETDGVPNRSARSTRGNYKTYDAVENVDRPDDNADDKAIDTLQNIKNTYQSNLKVHSIAFGTIVEDRGSKLAQSALNFLQRAQGSPLKENKIISGTARERQKKLLGTFQTSLQGDVTITLIE